MSISSTTATVSIPAYLLNVRAAISAISVPVGPHGSFDVAALRLSLGLHIITSCNLPFRTFTCTLLYPLVIFLTFRTTFDIPPPFL